MLQSDEFRPWEFDDDVRFLSRDVMRDLRSEPSQRRWHPSTKLRLLTLLRSDAEEDLYAMLE
jgi:hypothetical protein